MPLHFYLIVNLCPFEYLQSKYSFFKMALQKSHESNNSTVSPSITVRGHESWNLHARQNYPVIPTKAKFLLSVWPSCKECRNFGISSSGKSFMQASLWFLPALRKSFMKGSAPCIIYALKLPYKTEFPALTHKIV